MEHSMEQFCRNVGFLRKKHRLSQRRMAEILGVSTAAERKIEAGIPPESLSVCVLIHAYTGFGVSPEDILTLDLSQAPEKHFRETVTVNTFHSTGLL